MDPSSSSAARLHALIARWPQRADLISRLDKLMSLPRVPDVLVYGPACTGKTSVVRDVLSAPGRPPHAYVRCGPQASRLRPVLAAVVAQLAGRKRRREHGYAPTAGAVVVRSSSAAAAGATATAAPAAAPPPTTTTTTTTTNTTTTTTVVSGSAAASEAQLLWELRRLCPPTAPCRIIALDDVQALPPHQAHALLRAVLRLRDHAGANVSVLLVCGADGAATSLLGTLPPLQTVRFPPYDAAQMLELLARDAPAPPPALVAAVEAAAATAKGKRKAAAAVAASSGGSDDSFHDAHDEGDDDDDNETGLGALAHGGGAAAAAAAGNGNPSAAAAGAYRTFLASFVLPAAALCTGGGAGALPQLRALAASLWPAYGRALASHARPFSEDAQLAAHAAARPLAAAALRAFEPGLCAGSGARGAAEASAQRAGLGGWAGADARLAEAFRWEEERQQQQQQQEEDEDGSEEDKDDRCRNQTAKRAKKQKPSSAAPPPALHARLRAESAARAAASVVPPLDQAELQLPRSAKLLLVAAYLSSRNRASLDRQLFSDARASAAERGGIGGDGPAGGGGPAARRGARRRGGAGIGAAGGRPGGASMGQDRQAEAAREAALRGPHSFPLQRLMALYRVLRQASSGGGAATSRDALLVEGAAAAAGAGAAAGPLIGGRSLFAAGEVGGVGVGEGGGLGGGGATLASFVRRQQQQVQQVQPARSRRPSTMDADGADLLQEVASLVAARLLSAATGPGAAAGGGGGGGGGSGAAAGGGGGGDGHVSASAADAALDAPRFRCDAPPGLVQRCAVELGVNLASLLRYV